LRGGKFPGRNGRAPVPDLAAPELRGPAERGLAPGFAPNLLPNLPPGFEPNFGPGLPVNFPPGLPLNFPPGLGLNRGPGFAPTLPADPGAKVPAGREVLGWKGGRLSPGRAARLGPCASRGR